MYINKIFFKIYNIFIIYNKFYYNMNNFLQRKLKNKLYNENCQKFIEKYGILKKQDNSIIEGLSNLIYVKLLLLFL